MAAARFSTEFLTTKYKGGGGWKQVIIGEGDRPTKKAYSCTQLELVLVNGYHRGIVTMYHSCGGKDGQYQGLEVFDKKVNDILLQNACGCRYQKPTFPPCVGYKADQWMTFQVHVKIGTWYQNDKQYNRDSTIELWVAEEGKPSTLVISRTDYDIANTNPDAKYGKIWLLPYNTGKEHAGAPDGVHVVRRIDYLQAADPRPGVELRVNVSGIAKDIDMPMMPAVRTWRHPVRIRLCLRRTLAPRISRPWKKR